MQPEPCPRLIYSVSAADLLGAEGSVESNRPPFPSKHRCLKDLSDFFYSLYYHVHRSVPYIESYFWYIGLWGIVTFAEKEHLK